MMKTRLRTKKDTHPNDTTTRSSFHPTTGTPHSFTSTGSKAGHPEDDKKDLDNDLKKMEELQQHMDSKRVSFIFSLLSSSSLPPQKDEERKEEVKHDVHLRPTGKMQSDYQQGRVDDRRRSQRAKSLRARNTK